jgi:hypothetical protein
MRKLRWLFLAAALAVTFFQSSPNAQAVESAWVPPGEENQYCVLLDCWYDPWGGGCCSYECHPGGDVENCW